MRSRFAAARLHSRRNRSFDVGNPLDVKHVHQILLTTDRSRTLTVKPQQLGRHMVVKGVSGTGKSKLLELFGRHLFDSFNGFTFIDPHGDTVEAILHYIAKRAAEERWDDRALERVHYLEPSVESLFSFNPLWLTETDQGSFAFEAEREATVDKMVRVLLRSDSAADQEMMRRLQRWLRNALLAIATPRSDGRRLTFADLRIVLNTHHARHREVLAILRENLPQGVQLDYDFLHSLKRPQDQDHYLESTLNRLESFLTAMTSLIFGNHAPPIDLAHGIQSRHVFLVNLRAKRHLSRQAGHAIGDFIISQIRDICAEQADRGRRVPHHLIIDEASEFMAEDLGDFLDKARKWGLSVCMGAQQLSSFRRGEVDISGQVLAHCKTVISFQQRNNLEDVKELGEYFAYPNRVLSERMQVMDRPDPSRDEIVELVDRGVTRTATRAHSRARAKGIADGYGFQITQASHHATGTTDAESQAQHAQEGWSKGHGQGTQSHEGFTQGATAGHTPMFTDGQTLVWIPTSAEHSGSHHGTGRSSQEFEGESGGRGRSASRSKAETEMDGESDGQAWSRSAVFSATDIIGMMEASGVSVSRTVKQTLVQRTREEWHPTGDARFALPYQNAIHEYLLTTLPDQFAFLRSKVDNVEQTILFRVADVPDVFPDAATRDRVVGAFLKRLQSTKDYLFRPVHPAVAEEQRLAAFLGTDLNDGPDRNNGDGSTQSRFG